MHRARALSAVRPLDESPSSQWPDAPESTTKPRWRTHRWSSRTRIGCHFARGRRCPPHRSLACEGLGAELAARYARVVLSAHGFSCLGRASRDHLSRDSRLFGISQLNLLKIAFF